MPLKSQYNIPAVPQLIQQKSTEGAICFFVDKDYQHYLDLLHDFADENNCQVHAYVLMPNQVYLLATSYADQGISQMMQTLNRAYDAYLTRTYDNTGTLWESAYKSCVLESELYLLNAMSYIELSPLREKLVEQSADYQWSSYHHNALNLSDPVIQAHSVYMELAANQADRLQAYQDLLANDLDKFQVEEFNLALEDELVLGSSDFKDKMTQTIARETPAEECHDCIMFH